MKKPETIERVIKLMKENGMDHTDDLLVIKIATIYAEAQIDILKERTS